ncbi:MAG: hypothetical protein ABW321_01945 [Polyangiales bacterium]
MPNSTQTAVWLVLMLAAACGGAATTKSPDVPAASAGDEPPPAAAASAEPVSVNDATRTPRRGSLVVRAEVDGRAVNARARVAAADRVLEVTTGENIDLEPGTYQVEVSISDPSVLADKPTQRLGVFVESSQEASAVASFPWAKVQLNVLVGGRSQPGAQVKLLRGGQVVAELKSGAAHQLISPGKYEADVLLRGSTIRVKGLVFLESATQSVPVRAQL